MVREQMANYKPHSPSTVSMVTRSFVIPIAHDEQIKRLARHNHRTFSGEMRMVIENHLAAHADELNEREAA